MRRRLPRLLLASLLLAGPPQVTAAEGAPLRPDRVYLPFASHHTMPASRYGRDRWEEVNPGLILGWEDRGPGRLFDLGAGVIRNSHGIVAPTLSLGVSAPLTGRAEVGLTGSLVYYGGDGDIFDGHVGGGVFLVPALQARYGNAFAQLIPASGGPVLLFGLTFPIGTR